MTGKFIKELRKERKKSIWSVDRRVEREFRFLRVGEPFSKIKLVKHKDVDEAVKIWNKGGGRRITKAELTEFADDSKSKSRRII